MTTVNELAGKLEAVNVQLAKASQEIVAQVLALQLALADVALTPEAEAALDNLAVVAQSLDDLNPDVPVEV